MLTWAREAEKVSSSRSRAASTSRLHMAPLGGYRPEPVHSSKAHGHPHLDRARSLVHVPGETLAGKAGQGQVRQPRTAKGSALPFLRDTRPSIPATQTPAVAPMCLGRAMSRGPSHLTITSEPCGL